MEADNKLIEEETLLTCDIMAEPTERRTLDSGLCETGGSNNDSLKESEDLRMPHLELLSSSLLTQTEASAMASISTGGIPISIENIQDSDSEPEQQPQVKEFSRELEETSHCCNCNAALDDGSLGTSKLLDEITTCEIFHVKTRNLAKAGIKLRDILKILLRLQNSKEEAFIRGGDVVMCMKCIENLTKLYELYNEFLSISIQSSAIFAKVAENVANYVQEKAFITSTVLVSNVLETQTLEIETNGVRASKRKLTKIERNKDGQAVLKCEEKIATINEMNNKHSKSARPKKIKPKIKRALKPKRQPEASHKKIQKLEDSSTKTLSNRNQDFPIAKNLTSKTNQTEDDFDTSSDTCNRCGKQFKSYGGLRIHYASHLRDDNKIACKECGKKFKQLAALEMHERVDHKGFKPHSCPHEGCDRSFRLRDKLKLHIKVIHEKNKPFPCPKCEKSFRTKYHLKAHDVAQHIQGDTSIGCSQCRRKFASKEALESHIKTHEEEKHFVCSECNKGFKTASRLKLHSKSHETLPSAVCATCGKAYKHFRDLKLHEVVHEGESSYRFGCGDCPRRFYRIDLLRVHQSNQKHFSQEVIGPCVPRTIDFIEKVSTEEHELVSINDIDSKIAQDEKTDLTENKGLNSSVTAPVPEKRKRKNLQKTRTDISSKVKTNEPLYDCLGSPLLFPTMVPIDSVEDSSHGLEIVELAPVLSSGTIANSLHRKDCPPDGSGHPSLPLPSFIISTKDPVIPNVTTSTNSTAAGFTTLLTQQSHFPLPGQPLENVNASQFLKESSDRSIPSFSITAGAEQIGFDVINAFINNLN